MPKRDWVARRPEPARLLVIDEIPEALAVDNQESLAALFDNLRQARFVLLSAEHSSALDEAETIELLAEARATIGLGDPRDDETVEQLAAFLAARRDRLDGVLWLGRDDEPNQIAYQIVGDDSDREDVRLILQPSTARARPAGEPSRAALEYSIR